MICLFISYEPRKLFLPHLKSSPGREYSKIDRLYLEEGMTKSLRGCQSPLRVGHQQVTNLEDKKQVKKVPCMQHKVM